MAPKLFEATLKGIWDFSVVLGKGLPFSFTANPLTLSFIQAGSCMEIGSSHVFFLTHSNKTQLACHDQVHYLT